MRLQAQSDAAASSVRDRSARNHASSGIVAIVVLAFPLLSAQAFWRFISGVDDEIFAEKVNFYVYFALQQFGQVRALIRARAGACVRIKLDSHD